jgi:hypothetical protein
VWLLAAALAVAALLAGCGGGHSATSSATAATEQQSSASTPAPPTAITSTTAAANTTTAPAGTTTGATVPPTGPFWTYTKLLAGLNGRTVALSHSTLRLDSGLLECNGDGPSARTGTARSWRQYTCTQTVFAGGADHDVTFEVSTVSATQLKITSPRYGPE